MSDMDVVMGEAGNGGPAEIEEGIDFIQPVALLMDELKSEDTGVRVESMRRLRTIALALGPERTRNELVPFLQSSLDEEDEVLAALADELVGLLEYVGGPAYAHVLLPLLEGLVSTEEPYVRTKVLDAFETVLKSIPTQHLPEHILPAVQRLAIGDWFSKKSSASSLIVTFMERLLVLESEENFDNNSRGALGTELLSIFTTLAADETPLVRKAVANNLVKLAIIVDEPSRTGTLTPICAQLASDPQDSVRLLSVEPLSILMEKASSTTNEKSLPALIPLFLSLASDNSWRIRFMVASHYGKLASALESSAANSNVDILGIYCSLLRDAEAEVRTAACSQLALVTAVLNSPTLVEQIISSIRLLLSDPSPHVRAILGLQLNDLAKVLGPEQALQSVLPMILQLLKDESSEVRLNVISKLDIIVDVLGIDQLAVSLLPAIVALAEDRQWRVRQTIIEYIPELSMHLGKEFFDEKLASLVISWLNDTVFAVRETTVDSLKRLIRQFGSDWAVESGLLQRLLELGQHRNYLRRETLLFALASTCSVVSSKVISSFYIPALEVLSTDPIANVRFNVAKTLEAIIPVLLSIDDSNIKSLLNAPIIPVLQQLQRDSDVDVHDFATKTLNMVPAF